MYMYTFELHYRIDVHVNIHNHITTYIHVEFGNVDYSVLTVLYMCFLLPLSLPLYITHSLPLSLSPFPPPLPLSLPPSLSPFPSPLPLSLHLSLPPSLLPLPFSLLLLSLRYGKPGVEASVTHFDNYKILQILPFQSEVSVSKYPS